MKEISADLEIRMTGSSILHWVLRLVDVKRGPSTADRFASFYNAKLPRFNTSFSSTSCSGVGALAQNWRDDDFRALHPAPVTALNCLLPIFRLFCTYAPSSSNRLFSFCLTFLNSRPLVEGPGQKHFCIVHNNLTDKFLVHFVIFVYILQVAFSQL